MENKRRLVDTASYEGERGCSERKIDRLTNIPDSVAHHILSLLTISELARLSCVSKTCRHLCLSTPFLSLDKYDFKFDKPTCDRWPWLLNSVDRFLFLRRDQNIQSFQISGFTHSPDDDSNPTPCFCRDHVSFRMISWIHNAIRCNVEKLDFRFTKRVHDLRLPSSVFHCDSLRHLSVTMNRVIILAPSLSFSSNLQYLDLTEVDIQDEGIFKWISCSCKRIQELHLQEVHGVKNITVESSSLKIFSLKRPNLLEVLHISGEKLEDVVIQTWAYCSPSFNSSNIFAPNLKKFCWNGKLANHSNLGNFECLKYAEVNLDPNIDDRVNLFEVIRSLCSCEVVLTLNEEIIKVLALLKEDMMLAPFNYIEWLHLDIESFVDEIAPTMVSLLRRIPNLYGLCIKCHQQIIIEGSISNVSGFDVGYWKMQNLAFINELKCFIITLPNGINAVELARYILECARKLEIADIVCSFEDLKEVKRMLEKSKMISNASIVFNEKWEKW